MSKLTPEVLAAIKQSTPAAQRFFEILGTTPGKEGDFLYISNSFDDGEGSSLVGEVATMAAGGMGTVVGAVAGEIAGPLYTMFRAVSVPKEQRQDGSGFATFVLGGVPGGIIGGLAGAAAGQKAGETFDEIAEGIFGKETSASERMDPDLSALASILLQRELEGLVGDGPETQRLADSTGLTMADYLIDASRDGKMPQTPDDLLLDMAHSRNGRYRIIIDNIARHVSNQASRLIKETLIEGGFYKETSPGVFKLSEGAKVDAAGMLEPAHWVYSPEVVDYLEKELPEKVVALANIKLESLSPAAEGGDHKLGGLEGGEMESRGSKPPMPM